MKTAEGKTRNIKPARYLSGSVPPYSKIFALTILVFLLFSSNLIIGQGAGEEKKIP